MSQITPPPAALEALIATLRTHLTRLTSELSHHSKLLEELRTLRDSDVRALKEKSRDVDQLRQEVERLAGEVEVLRGVVEEGLKERREVREQSMERSREGSSRHSSHSKSILQEIDDANKTHAGHLMDGSESEDDGSSSSGRSTPSPSPTTSPCHNRTRTARTDAATVASSSPGAGALSTAHGLTSESRPFLHTEELERISEELSDRRLEQSASASTISLQHQQQRPRSQLSVNRDGSPVGWVRRSVSVSGHHRPHGKGNGYSDAEGSNAAAVASAPPVPHPVATTTNRVGGNHPQQPRERPSQQPKPHQKRSFTEPHEKDPAAEGPRAPLPAAPAPSTETETPFPQIRGAQLERLFFSAPEHNAETCTVCHRRARNRYGHEDAQHDGDDRRNLGQRFRDAETEGEGEGGHGVGKGRGKGKERECAEGQERVPPQTVVVRVLRELEDDFTHYKGWVCVSHFELWF